MKKSAFPLLLPLLSFILGILLTDAYLLNLNISHKIFLGGLLGLGLSAHFTSVKTSFVPLFLSFVTLGIFFHLQTPEILKDKHFSKFDADVLMGKICETKSTKIGTKMTIEVTSVEQNNSWNTSLGKTIVNIKGQIDLEKGSVCMFPGSYQRIPEFRNPKAFNYAHFLQRKNIFHQIFCDSEEVILVKRPTLIDQSLNKIRAEVKSTFLERLSNAENASIVNALLLGEKQEMDASLRDLFIQNGLAHLLAISGMHVGIIFLIFSFFLQFIPWRHIKNFVLLAGIWAYIVISGADTPAIRAGVMLSVYLVGVVSKRNYKPLNGLFFTAFALLCFDTNAIFQVSFQLSFAAMASIFLFYPTFEKLLSSRYKILNHLGKITALNLSVQVLVLPISIFYFKQMPTYFLLNSLISLPFISIIIWLAVCSMATGFAEILQSIFYSGLDKLVSLYIEILGHLDTLPHAQIKDIQLTGIQLSIWIFTALFAYYLIRVKPLKVSRICFSFVPLLLIGSLQKIDRAKACSIVAYDLKKQLIIDLHLEGETFRFQDQKSTPTPTFYIKEISETRKFSYYKKYSEPLFFSKDGLIEVYGNKLQILDVKADSSFEADICFAHKRTPSFKVLQQCKKVVFSRDFDPDTKEKLKTQLIHSKINIHDTYSEGSFTLKLKKQ